MLQNEISTGLNHVYSVYFFLMPNAWAMNDLNMLSHAERFAEQQEVQPQRLGGEFCLYALKWTAGSQ